MHASLIASEASAGSSKQELDRLRSELERMESEKQSDEEVNAKALADVSELKLGAETTLQQRTEADKHHEAVLASLKAHTDSLTRSKLREPSELREPRELLH